MPHKLSLQSALEYVTTYGWAILIIAIALVALIVLGVFNTNSSGGTYCVPQPGYSCTSPVLNTSGYMSIDFETISSAITMNGTACTTNTSAPHSFLYPPNAIQITPYVSTKLLFLCSLPDDAIGTHILETLWIRADPAGDPTQDIKIATASVSVTTNGSVITTVTTTTSVASSTSSSSSSTSTTSTTTSSTSTIPAGYYTCGLSVCQLNQTGYICPSACPYFDNSSAGMDSPLSCLNKSGHLVACVNDT